MFAIVKTGGKQYRVEEQQEIRVEKPKDIKLIDSEILEEKYAEFKAAEGKPFTFDEVLMASDGKTVKIASAQNKLAGVKVEATIVRVLQDKKVIVFKKKRRHNYRRKKGHRQHLAVIKINKIVIQ